MARRTRYGLLSLSLSLLAASASAQAPDPKVEAGRHFKQGLELANEGEFVAASIEFQRAYDIQPSFAVLYNLGQAYVGANRSVEAIDAFERYLKDGGTKVPAPRRAEVEETIRKQLTRTGTIELTGLPPSTAVRLNGKAVVLAGPIRVSVGEHELAATAPDFKPQTRTVAVAGGDRLKLELKLEPVGLVAPVAAATAGLTPPPVPPPVETARDVPQATATTSAPVPGGFIAAWAVAGAGVIAFGVGVGFGAATQEPYQREVRASEANDLQGYRAAKAEADGLATAANVLYIAGGALAATGVVLVIVTWPKAPSVAVMPVPGGGVAFVSGTF